MSKNKRKDIVYSTNPNFEYEEEQDYEQETLSASEQHLKVLIDRKQRKGKVVTLVTNFIGRSSDLDELAKELKKHCGVGGNAKEDFIIIQGDNKDKIVNYLRAKGYKVTPV